jgi:CubicO group peptidase (beta-lactamase class C family)
MSVLALNRFSIEGHVSPGFEAVRETFAENFSRRHELGGACCVFHRGEKVVDLWDGVRNKSTGEPWQEDTMALLWSATKGLAAMTLALAHSRGWLDYLPPLGKFVGCLLIDFEKRCDLTNSENLAHPEPSTSGDGV